MPNTFPKLHNAMWPGIVGKGAPDSEPIIPLDTLLELTAGAEADGQKFDGVDLFIVAPHFDIDSDLDAVKRMSDHIASYGLAVGSFVAPIWNGAGGGSAMGTPEERQQFLTQVRKASEIGRQMRELGIRPSGGIRIDSSTPVEAWDKDPKANSALIAETFREAGRIAADHGEFVVAEGEICWGGMHSWRTMRDLLEAVAMPGQVGYQADMAHSMLYTLGYNAESDRILPKDFDWSDTAALDAAYRQVADALRPWTLDFHVAQNDGTVFGSGDHEKTGRHCQVTDPNGRLDVVKHAGFWLRDETGALTKKMRHICWDGCMFPNAVMEDQQTWNDVLGAMVRVREAHGWTE
jgi:sugar phosphate isomerase/epimerase